MRDGRLTSPLVTFVIGCSSSFGQEYPPDDVAKDLIIKIMKKRVLCVLSTPSLEVDKIQETNRYIQPIEGEEWSVI